MPTDVFYADKGTDNWYQADFGIVDWGTRASPITYFKLALTSDAAVELLALEQPGVRRDRASRSRWPWTRPTRADLYKQAQALLQDEVPMMNFIVLTGVAGESPNVDGIELDPDWAHTTFTTAYFTE